MFSECHQNNAVTVQCGRAVDSNWDKIRHCFFQLPPASDRSPWRAADLDRHALAHRELLRVEERPVVLRALVPAHPVDHAAAGPDLAAAVLFPPSERSTLLAGGPD